MTILWGRCKDKAPSAADFPANSSLCLPYFQDYSLNMARKELYPQREVFSRPYSTKMQGKNKVDVLRNTNPPPSGTQRRSKKGICGSVAKNISEQIDLASCIDIYAEGQRSSSW